MGKGGKEKKNLRERRKGRRKGEERWRGGRGGLTGENRIDSSQEVGRLYVAFPKNKIYPVEFDRNKCVPVFWRGGVVVRIKRTRFSVYL